MARRRFSILGSICFVIVVFTGYETFITTATKKEMSTDGIVNSEPKVDQMLATLEISDRHADRSTNTPTNKQEPQREVGQQTKLLESAKAPTNETKLRAQEYQANVLKIKENVAPNTESLEKPAAPKQEVPTKPDPLKWKSPNVPEDIVNADQNDPRLIKHIKDHWILPPFTGPRKLRNPDQIHYSQRGQSAYIDELLKQKNNGFYIECGAAHGESLSNSLFFEKTRNWTGILIEANPNFFRNILKIKRHAYMLRACLSPSTKAEVMDFSMANYIGGLTDHMESGHKARVNSKHGDAETVKIQCFPMLSILKALNITHVDYFSLDIEGAEYEILKALPFDEIKVDVLTIEYRVSNSPAATTQKLKKITDLMIGRYGYQNTTYIGAEDIMLSKGV